MTDSASFEKTTMDEVVDIAQADALREELYACYRQEQHKQQEEWKKYASKFPELRVWLANRARLVRENVRNALDVARAAREYGSVVSAETGVSVGKQIFQQLYLYNQYRVPPDSYYFLGMYEKSVRKKARFFLGDQITSRVLYYLATTAPDGESAPLNGKIAFWNHCRNHELSTVPILAVFSQGSLQKDYRSVCDALPSRDLFSKPAKAFLGQGTRQWTYEDAGGFTDGTGRAYSSRAVIDTLKEQSKEGMLLLQPCVRDHSHIQEITGRTGPSTLRIITIRKKNKAPEYFASFLTTPFKDVSAPTFKGQTALAAHVDEDTGQLGRLLYKRANYLLEDRKRHPLTGERATGVALPYWVEAKALALQAHATLPGIACVGWDLILTDDGPVLLEGNNDCSAALTQITHERLLGLTRLPVYLSAYIEDGRQLTAPG